MNESPKNYTNVQIDPKIGKVARDDGGLSLSLSRAPLRSPRMNQMARIASQSISLADTIARLRTRTVRRSREIEERVERQRFRKSEEVERHKELEMKVEMRDRVLETEWGVEIQRKLEIEKVREIG